MTRSIPILVVTILGSFLSALVLTWATKNYAVRVGMLDSPNERSSHSVATPRGGGLAIVIPMAVVLTIIAAFGLHQDRSTAALLLVTVALAALGWFEDRHRLHIVLRLGIQGAAGVTAIVLLGPFEHLDVAGYSISLGITASLVTILWFLWMTNLYNFMDGIDGIAASQAAVAGCAMGIWFTLYDDHVMAMFSYAIMAASLGFLIWNWSPARIFMGDVGSLSLGGVFAVLALIANKVHQIPLGAFVLLFGVFLVDATLTLVKRTVQRKVVWRAHREHFYQRAVIAGWSHAQVTAAVTVTSVLLAVLGTFEARHYGPGHLWMPLGLLLISLLAYMVIKKERPLSR